MATRISSMIDLFESFEDETDCIENLYELRTRDGWVLPSTQGELAFPSRIASKDTMQPLLASRGRNVQHGDVSLAHPAQEVVPSDLFYSQRQAGDFDKRACLRVAHGVEFGLLPAEPHQRDDGGIGVSSTCFPVRLKSTAPI